MDRKDVFGALAWGLRRYAWLVVLSIVVIGVLVPFGLSRSAPVYEAQAVLAPNQQVVIPSLDALPRYGEVVFFSGAVAQAVRDAYGLAATTPIIPDRVELVTEQDNVAFTVIGRADNPSEAADLANIAAVAFSRKLNQTSEAVGTFIVLSGAERPVAAEPTLAGGALALAIGVLGGLIIGLALVVLLVVLRRPVLDAEAAQEVTGAPVLGRVTMPGGPGGVTAGDVRGVAGLCRRLLADASSVVLFVGPKKSAALRHRLTPVLTSLLSRSRSVVASRGGEQDLTTQWGLEARRNGRKTRNVPGTPKTELVLVDGPTAEERITRPDSALMVLVVAEGIGVNALRQSAEEYFDGGAAGVVLVRKRGLGHRRRKAVADDAPSLDDLLGRGRARDDVPERIGDEPGSETAGTGRPDRSAAEAPTSTGRF